MALPVYFISDLHLSEDNPQLTDLFLKFMRQQAVHASAVYILGDLFDFWVGDDACSETAEQVCQAVSELTNRGINCFFIHGNRDFLLGKRFAHKCGMVLLPEYYVADVFGRKTLLCHGDTLCIDDVSYQRFRKKVQQKWRQKLFLMLPLSIRLNIAEKIRSSSRNAQRYKTADIMDVNPQFTADMVKRYGVKYLIHGHTHRENQHHENGFERIVLGDWQPNRASILRADENGFAFV